MEMEIAILGLVLVSCGAIGMVIFVFLNSSIKLVPYKAKRPDKDRKIGMTGYATSWAKERGLDFLGYYTIRCGMRGFMTAWKVKEKPTFLCQYVVGAGCYSLATFEFVTFFENEIELSTANLKEGNWLPKPSGNYAQSFSVHTLDELYDAHRRSEDYLVAKGGARIAGSDMNFEEDFVNSLKRENRYRWKHWYLFLLVSYFFFVRKRKTHNKTIEQQHELGMIRLPNEIFAHVEG